MNTFCRTSQMIIFTFFSSSVLQRSKLSKMFTQSSSSTWETWRLWTVECSWGQTLICHRSSTAIIPYHQSSFIWKSESFISLSLQHHSSISLTSNSGFVSFVIYRVGNIQMDNCTTNAHGRGAKRWWIAWMCFSFAQMCIGNVWDVFRCISQSVENWES